MVAPNRHRHFPNPAVRQARITVVTGTSRCAFLALCEAAVPALHGGRGIALKGGGGIVLYGDCGIALYEAWETALYVAWG